MDVLRSMEIFEKVAQEQSFSRAAEKLNLVPSAVSRQVSELEKWLNVRLINRTTRALHLTDEGRRYLQKMSHISAQIAELRNLGKQEESLTGHIKITAPVMLGQHEIPELLSRFQKQHPDVSISLTLMNRKVDMVEEGYDIAIRAGHLPDSNLYARKVGEVSFKTVASPGYLKNSPPLTYPQDLHDHNCIVNSAMNNPGRWAYRMGDKHKIYKIDGNIESNDSTCILGFVIAGQGVARLPGNYLQHALDSGALVEVLEEYRSQPLPVHILYPSNRLMSVTLRVLIDFLVANFNSSNND